MSPSALPFVALLLAGCAADEPAARVVPAGPEPAWPTVVPEAAAPPGYTWQTLRHQTVHARLLVPDGALVTESEDTAEAPSIRVERRPLTAELTFNPRAAWAVPGLAATPPHVGTDAVFDVRRTADAVAWRSETPDGGARVTAYARGVACTITLGPFERASLEAAFTVCGSLRPPPLGAWGPSVARANGTAVPAGAWVEPPRPQMVGDSLLGPYAPRIYAGWFGVLRKSCPADFAALETLEEGEAEVTVTRHDTAVGPAYLRSARATREGVTFASGARVVAPREKGCCEAELFPFLAAPSAAEVDYVVALCDTTGG